jgi:hypothetical protein
MTLTESEYREIKALIDAGYNTKQIMRRLPYSQAQVLEARAERSRGIERERSARNKLARKLADALEHSERDLLTALRASLPPLTSLAFALGRPVRFGGPWRADA